MDPQQLTSMAHKFQAVLDADVLNERGDQLGICQRQRLITPFRFGLSVIASRPSLVLFLLFFCYAFSGYVMWAMGHRVRPVLPEE